MPGCSIDWNGMAQALGYSDAKMMAWDMYFERKWSIQDIEEYLGVSQGALKYHMKKWWPGVSFRPRWYRRHKT